MAPQQARLELELDFDGRRSRPRRALATPPLQISRARYDDPADAAHLGLTLIHLGGVLAGDRYDLAVELGAGARASVTAAAATQIYSMPAGEAQQQTRIRAAAGSWLRWMPGPQILFAQARYRQTTTVELADGAFVLLGEILVPGRLARGEIWRFDSYASLLEVVGCDGALLAAERLAIEPGRRTPALGGRPVLGSLWLLGAGVQAERAARLVGAGDGGVSAAVLPGRCGLLLRVQAAGLAAAQETMGGWECALAAAGLIPRGPAR